MKPESFPGTALITGASGGIGYELARLFATDKINLILVARQTDQLTAIKADFEQRYSIQVDYISLDLSLPGQAEQLYEQLQAKSVQIDYLVNNAGYGDYGPFAQTSPALYVNMLNLNVVFLTTLTALLLPDMIRRKFGRILNIGSLAAFQPVPQMAVYGASKTYVMHFTEALHAELAGTGVTATVLSPGVTKTGFVARAKMGSAVLAQGALQQPAAVARAGYRGMQHGRLNVVPGWRDKLLAISTGLMPSRRLLLAISTWVTRPSR